MLKENETEKNPYGRDLRRNNNTENGFIRDSRLFNTTIHC